MNLKETAQILAIMKSNYPDTFRDKSDEATKAVFTLWQQQFADERAEDVMAAVMAHIASDTNRFMPPVGVIKAMLVKLRTPEEMSEMEAWNLVRKAIRGASMAEWSRVYSGGQLDTRTSAERNFDALPELLQRVVGSPAQLAEWEKLDSDQIDTVLQSNFMRSYRVRSKNEREYLALPTAIRTQIEQLTARAVKSLPSKEVEV